jgi:hypothetical protein
MTQYAALTHTGDVDWSAPEQAAEMEEYGQFSVDHAASIRGGAALYPTSTATTVRDPVRLRRTAGRRGTTPPTPSRRIPQIPRASPPGALATWAARKSNVGCA